MKMLDHSAGGTDTPALPAPWSSPPAGVSPAPDPTPPRTRVFLPRNGLSPLAAAAHPLLELGVLLRHGSRPPPLALDALRTRLVAMVREFVEACASIDTDTVAAARYCLCTYVDEAIAETAWGGQAWSTRSLLVILHGESSGGERFFTILHQLSRDPAANIDALELLSVMLALGMQGRYRLSREGAGALEQVRHKLRILIRDVRGTPDAALSARGRGDNVPGKRHEAPRPIWFVIAGVFCGLASLHGWLDLRLDREASTVLLARDAVHARSPAVPPPRGAAAPDTHAAVPQPAAVPAAPFAAVLDQRLSADIAARRLRVAHRADRAVLTLDSDTLFASGSARVARPDLDLMQRIGEALHDTPGQIVVVGHTDDQRPAPGAPSNWALSLARATQVVELLRQPADPPQRFLAQGAGSTQPVASNDTPAGQARNRRVVITVLAPGASL